MYLVCGHMLLVQTTCKELIYLFLIIKLFIFSDVNVELPLTLMSPKPAGEFVFLHVIARHFTQTKTDR